MSGYRTKYQTVTIGGTDFHIQSLKDAQQYHDPEGEAERLGISPESWPLFGQIWPSSHVLATAMHTMDVQGKRVLELGAGLALASLVVHSRGGNMTVSDYHPLIPTFLTENLRLNQLGPIKYQSADWSRTDLELGQFDLIIGSDLIYERDQPAILADFIDRHSADQVEILIVDPDRRQRSRFCREMQELEYSYTMSRADCILNSGEAYKGSFLHFRRDEATAGLTCH
ncbi:lysine methyltransferase [Pseudomonas duriflava]|uniref:Calmodulin-lysine N-methyltransferase n=1 Tax=Pseudomonas duriflava TaxID=459528 RepID=A0A562QNI7_9PSED|nr:SAM-dependent methyltransferase [Pseudomonas duriflava]TWI57626.1 lysine methyltransferase [Pseudomonas duriflava]